MPICLNGPSNPYSRCPESTISAELDNLPPEELECLAQIARATIVNAGLMTTAMQRRFENRQYQAPMIRNYIKHAYAEERYGARWMELPDSLKPA